MAVILSKKHAPDKNGHLRKTPIRSIELDFSSLDDLVELRNIVSSRIGEIRSLTSQTTRQLKFDACCSIIDTDISSLYSHMSLDEEKKYYVYAHCEPKPIAVRKDPITTWAATVGFTHVPFYIGKGSGNRAYELNRNETHRKVKQKLASLKSSPVVTIIKSGLSERDALILESKLIDIFGVIGKNGRLTNLDEGLLPKERRAMYSDSFDVLNKINKTIY